MLSDTVMENMLIMFSLGMGGMQEDAIVTVGVLVDGECCFPPIFRVCIVMGCSDGRGVSQVHAELPALLAGLLTKCG